MPLLLFSVLLCINAVLAFPYIRDSNCNISVRQFGPQPRPQSFPNAPSFLFPGDAPYGATTAQLSHILNCPSGQPSASSKTVLLVHGTGSTGYESWAHGYVPALTAVGYTVCYVSIRKTPLPFLLDTETFSFQEMDD